MFVNRPVTNGRHRLIAAVTMQHIEFVSVAGVSLGALTNTILFQPDGHDFYESSFRLTSDRITMAASFGLTDRIDVGISVPVGRVAVSGTQYFTTSGYHRNQEVINGASSGVGDMILHAKGAVLSTQAVNVAVGVNVHIPSGDPNKLLGTGVAQTQVLLIGGLPIRSVRAYFNAGYTFGGGGLALEQYANELHPDSFGRLTSVRSLEPSPEGNYAAGLDFNASARITFTADVIGRALRNAGIARFSNTNFDRSCVCEVTGLTVTTGTLNLLLGSAGAKIGIGRLWVLSISALLPLTDSGVKAAVTPVIGFERAF
jgi:hypothetical protein